MPTIVIHDAASAERAVEPEPPRGLAIEIVAEAGDWHSFGDMASVINPVLAAAAAHPVLRPSLPAQACLALLDDAAMRRLNAQFRAKDKPTNVLSFPAIAMPEQDGARPLGDIALGFETVMREAAAQSIEPADHVRHLVLHGLLHLIGYDHETEQEAQVMEQLEIEILARIGVANPYEEAVDAPRAP
jgi:probable rRNA maturation factor